MEHGFFLHIGILLGLVTVFFILRSFYKWLKEKKQKWGTNQLLYLLFWSQIVWRIIILSALLIGITEITDKI